MFKLPLALVLRLKWTGDLRYSIGVESPDPDIAAGATKMLHRMMDATAPKGGELPPDNGAQEPGQGGELRDEGDGAQGPATRQPSRAERRAAERKPPH